MGRKRRSGMTKGREKLKTEPVSNATFPSTGLKWTVNAL
jgi:hypothetical protein